MEAGVKMVVFADELACVIGGGTLKYKCEAVARRLPADGREWLATHDFLLGLALGQCRGGHGTVLFQMVRPPQAHVALFGSVIKHARFVSRLPEIETKEPAVVAFSVAAQVL